MLLGVIEEAGEMESGFFFSATLETLGLSLEFSVGMEEGYEEDDTACDALWLYRK